MPIKRYRCERLSLTTGDPRLCEKRRAALLDGNRGPRFPICQRCIDELVELDELDLEPASAVPAPPAKPTTKQEDVPMGKKKMEKRRCPICGKVKEITSAGYCAECRRAKAREYYYKKKAAAETAPAPAPKAAPKAAPAPVPELKREAEKASPLTTAAETAARAQAQAPPSLTLVGEDALAVAAFGRAAAAEPQHAAYYARMIGKRIIAAMAMMEQRGA
ncbi:MAG: hypothetical protein P9L99_13420 [Candidatus Lernaella stagnicola]|nr:hypothetical protein [Candidatus Lernaella stagnicola]